MLRVRVYSGVLKQLLMAQCFVMMMARRVGFVTVTSEFVWIRFRLAVRRLRSLCWASIVCGTLSS